MSEIKTISIIGAGQMGAGIAQVAASYGYKTNIYDNRKESLDKAKSGIKKQLEKLIEKSKITIQQSDSTQNNITYCSKLEDINNSDLVIEAIIENFAIKSNLFSEIEKIVSPNCIIASNTSSISITKMAAVLDKSERFIGMHFMNPVPVMQLVEVIRGLQTSDNTYDITMKICNKIGKTAVTAKADYPGFIVNRILVPMINEAFYTLMEGIAEAKEIDAAMKLGTNQPMGPLELADFVGLDTLLSICEILHTELGDPKYRPCPLLRKYVEAGWYGRKTSQGVYKY